jgi:hypothetical protein
MANGTTIASLLAGSEEPQQGGMQGEDTLEGARADGDSDLPRAETLDPSLYLSQAADPAPDEVDLLPLPADSAEENADQGSGDAPADTAAEEEDPGPCNAPEDSGSAGQDADQGIAGASAPAGAANLIMGIPNFDGARIAIGDWRDPNWNGTGWVKILPAEGDVPADIDGDGFEDAVPGDYGDYGSYADSGYSYGGGYYGDGSGDIDGDGWEDGGGGGYDYAGSYDYSITSAGDVNGDGFDDWLVEGDGYSYYQYGGDYAYYGGGYTSTSAGDVNGDGFEDWLVEGYGNSYIQYGSDYSYADYSYSYSYEGDGASYGGDGPDGISVEHGEATIFYAGGPSWSEINLQLSGNGVVNWNDFEISAGDGQARIFTADSPAVLNSVQLTTTSILGELASPAYLADA